jgi:hypothetical protein
MLVYQRVYNNMAIMDVIIPIYRGLLMNTQVGTRKIPFKQYIA